MKFVGRILSYIFLVSILVNCKKDNGFDLLQGGSNDSNVDALVITDRYPEVSNVIMEIDDIVEFFVTAQAPIGRTITYTWFLDGSMVASGSTTRYSFTGTSLNVGNHALKVVVSDEKTTLEENWTVKVNGPPVVTPVTSGTPKVSVSSSIVITAAGTDPNSDTLTYTWLLNGLPSSNLIGSGATATLTGAATDVGAVNITVTASDGTATDSYTWTAEINYFPNACNTLTQGSICTYAGNPSVGNNENPASPIYDIRIQPISQTQDALGNYFIADYGNSVVWYWNKTSSAVSRLGLSIPANTFTLVAGTGEYATGNDGQSALTSAINRPRGLAYDDITGTLYISDYSGSRIRYVDSSGIIYTGIGGGASNVDGASAFTHACANPTSLSLYAGNLYMACFGGHRVKRWDLATDLAYTVYGNGTNAIGADGSAPTAAGGANPYDIFIDADGLYVAHMNHHVIRFVNLSGMNKQFWTGTASATTVNSNTVRTIIGTGAAGNTASGNSLSVAIGAPSGLIVSSNLIFFNIRNGNADRFYLANNTGSNVTISGVTVTARTTGTLSSGTAGYNGTGVNINLANINEPYDMSIDVLDSTKIIYSDYSTNRLRQMNLTTQKIEDLIGSGNLRADTFGDSLFPTLQHFFNATNGVTYQTSTRTLFFADQNNNRIRSVSPYGEVQTVLGTGGGGAPVTDNDSPSSALTNMALNGTNNVLNGIHLLSDGTLVFSNSRSHNIRAWNRSGAGANYGNVYIQSNRVSNIAGDYVSGAGNDADGVALATQINSPAGIVSYGSGVSLEIFVSDHLNHCIRKIDASGNLTRVLGTCGASGDAGNNTAAGATLLNRPHGLAVDSLGNLIITDTYNHKIRYWNRTGSSVSFAGQTIAAGNVMTIACNGGSAGSPGENVISTAARCNQPMGVSVNSSRICFAQYARHNVRCINVSDGRINTVAGRPENSPQAGSPVGFEQEGIQGTSCPLYNPVDVTFDDVGDLFISDTNNHIVRKLKLTP